jgi:hypothetical protein
MKRWNRQLAAVVGSAILGMNLGGVNLGLPVQAAPTEQVFGGSTAVRLSSDFVDALGSLGVQPGVVGLARLRQGVAAFPISGGQVDLGTAKTEISHLGGLSLTAGETTVELTDFVISTLGDRPVLTGLVTVNDSLAFRAPLFALKLPSLTLPLSPQRSRLVVPEVEVTLTKEAADALNQVFNVSAFQPGFNIGTATVRAGVIQMH